MSNECKSHAAQDFLKSRNYKRIESLDELEEDMFLGVCKDRDSKYQEVDIIRIYNLEIIDSLSHRDSIDEAVFDYDCRLMSAFTYDDKKLLSTGQLIWNNNFIFPDYREYVKGKKQSYSWCQLNSLVAQESNSKMSLILDPCYIINDELSDYVESQALSLKKGKSRGIDFLKPAGFFEKRFKKTKSSPKDIRDFLL